MTTPYSTNLTTQELIERLEEQDSKRFHTLPKIDRNWCRYHLNNMMCNPISCRQHPDGKGCNPIDLADSGFIEMIGRAFPNILKHLKAAVEMRKDIGDADCCKLIVKKYDKSLTL